MIEYLELEDFKSFRSARVTMGPLTVLVGANASGKSNLRDALRFLHGVGLGYSLPEIIGEKYGQGGILQWRGIRGGAREAAFAGGRLFRIAVGIVPKGSRAPLRYHLRVDLSDEKLGPRVVSEGLWRGMHYLYDSDPTDDPVQQGADHQIRVRQPRGGRYRAHGQISDFSSSRPALGQIPDRKNVPAHLRRTCESVLEALGDMRFLDLEPDAMRKPSQPGQVVLGDKGENLSSVLQAICGDPAREAALLEWVHALTPMDASSFDFRSDFSGNILLHLVEVDGQRISAHSASDGTLRFLAMVAALHSEDTGRLYFFEEIDNGIHPARLHLLLRLLEQASDAQGIQVVATTHNPALVSYLDASKRADAHLVYRPQEASDTRVRRLGELPTLERVLEKQDLGSLQTSGWLEDAAYFSEPDRGEG